MNLYYGNENNMNPNLLVIHIQPDEGITLYLNAKKLGRHTRDQSNWITAAIAMTR